MARNHSPNAQCPTPPRRFPRSRRRFAPIWWSALPAFALLFTLFGVVGVADALPSGLVPRVQDGEGIKAGERSTFHAGLALGIGGDTNVYYEDRVEDPRAAGVIWPSTWFGIGNRQVRDNILMTPPERSGRWLDYNISALAGFRQYLHRERLIRQVSRFSVGAQIRLVFLPGRKFSVELDDDVFRGAAAANYETGDRFTFNRVDHRGALTLIGRPGGGRLSLAVGYRNQLLYFEDKGYNKGDRLVNGLFHETKWRFLPKSSIVFQYTFDFTYYMSCCANVGEGRNEDNYAHRLLAGYRGQLSKKITLDVLVGWGLAYYRQDPNGPNFSSFIGNAAFNYFPTMRTTVTLGAFRSFQDSLFGNYYVDTGGRFVFSHEFRWRMFASVVGSVAGRTYHGLPGFDPVEDMAIAGYGGDGAGRLRSNGVVGALGAKLEQPFGRIFTLGLSYDLVLDSRDFQVTYESGAIDELGYAKHVILLLSAIRI